MSWPSWSRSTRDRFGAANHGPNASTRYGQAKGRATGTAVKLPSVRTGVGRSQGRSVTGNGSSHCPAVQVTPLPVLQHLQRRGLTGEHDYSQWQRTRPPRHGDEAFKQVMDRLSTVTSASEGQSQCHPTVSQGQTSAVRNSQVTATVTLPTIEAAINDPVKVGRQQMAYSTRKPILDKARVVRKPRKPQESAAVRLLRLKLAQMEDSVEWWTKRAEELEEKNINEWMKMKDDEDSNYTLIDSQLKPDCRHEGKMAALELGKQHVREELDKTRALQMEREREIIDLQAQCDSIEEQVEGCLKEIEALVVFKEKTLPESSVHLAEMRKQSDTQKANNDSTITRLDAMIQSQVQASRDELMREMERIPHKAAQAAGSATNFLMHRIDLQNDSLREQVAMFKKNRDETAQVVTSRDEQIRKMRDDLKELRNARLGFLTKYKTPCLPSDEITLSFEKKKSKLLL